MMVRQMGAASENLHYEARKMLNQIVPGRSAKLPNYHANCVKPPLPAHLERPPHVDSLRGEGTICVVPGVTHNCLLHAWFKPLFAKHRASYRAVIKT